MNAIREAIVLPALFLSVVLIAGINPAGERVLVAPGPFSLVLGVLLLGSLVRSGAVAPERLMHPSRGSLANVNGGIAMLTLYAAAAQLLARLTPDAGLPLFFVSVFLFVLLLNTWVSLPDRVHLLRSLMVILGAAFVVKFVLLAAVSDPANGRARRVLVALLDAATFGGLSQAPQPPVAPYLAFVAVVLFLVGVWLLPGKRGAATALVPAPRP